MIPSTFQPSDAAVWKRRFGATLLGVAMLACCMAVQGAERLDRIMETKVLRVGTPGDYRPFAIKGQDGAYEGHDIDLIEAMAAEMGMKIEYVETTWKTLLPDLKADRFDVAVGGITRNVTRISQVAMLPGYASFGKVALVRDEHKDRFVSLESLNQPDVRVIKNPGGTNEIFVNEHLGKAQVQAAANKWLAPADD